MKRSHTTLGSLACGIAVAWCQHGWAAGNRIHPPGDPPRSHGATRLSEPPTELSQLASALAGASAAERAAFARTALVAMAEQYRQEIDKARGSPAADAKGRRKVARWSAATVKYVDGLYDFVQRIDAYAPVEIIASRTDPVQLMVDGMPVIISGPRIADPDSLGRTIVGEFCRLRKCVFDVPAGPASSTRVRRPPDDRLTGWDFGDASGSTFVTVDGVHFMFAGLSDRSAKQDAAMAVVRDLRSLVDALSAAAAQGHAVDWDSIRIDATPVAGEHRVVVNRHGDYLVLPLPALSRTAAILRSSRPWIRGRAEGRDVQQYLPRAETLLAAILDGRHADATLAGEARPRQ